MVEFYVDENNKPQSHVIYQKVFGKPPILKKPTSHLIEYLENQNIDITDILNGNSSSTAEDPFADKEEKKKEEAPKQPTAESPIVNQQPVTKTPEVINKVPMPPAEPKQSPQPTVAAAQPQQPVVNKTINVVATPGVQAVNSTPPVNTSSVVQPVSTPTTNNTNN